MWINRLALKIYFFIRLPFIWILSLILKMPKSPIAGKPKAILLIRLDRLGDLVLSIPVIDNLRLSFPDADITILVRKYLHGLAGIIQNIDEVIVYEGLINTARALRQHDFDIAIDMLFDYKLKSAFLAFFSGASKRVGFQGGFREIFFTDSIKSEVKGRSMVDINLDIIKSLGIPVKVRTPRIDLGNVSETGKDTVVIHPGGYYPSQRWDADRFAEIAKRIKDDYEVDVIILGGPGEECLVEGMMRKLKDVKIEVAFSDMQDLALRLSRSSLLICNNSGPLHLAAALGVPTVSTMGPTDPNLWWPQGENNTVIRKDLPCSPCGKGRCKKHKCMESITVEEVFDKVKGVLDGAGAVKRCK